MSQKRLIFSIILLATFLLGCSGIDEKPNKATNVQYFDLSGLVESQIQMLNREKPNVLKKAYIDGKKEDIVVTDIDWKKELSLFAAADLNKPRLLALYLTNEFENELGDKVTQYSLKEQDLSGVTKMEIIKNESAATLKKIYIETCEFNLLFTAEQSLQLNFDGSIDNPVLTSYSIAGFEKMVMKDTMTYKISGEIK